MSNAGIEIRDRVLIRYIGNDTEIVVDDDILSIADNAFNGNQSIETVSIQSPNLRTIGKQSFSNCKNLKTIQVKAIRGGIGESAFEGCTNLTKFIIPHGMMEIGSRAFYQCSPHFLIFIPSSVYVIGEQAIDKDCVIVGNLDSYAKQYAEKESVAFRIDLDKTIKDLHKRALIEKNGYEKDFIIFDETVTASSTLRIYQSVLEYYQNEKERLSDLALKGLPTRIPMSSGQTNAFMNVLNTANNGTKTLISRVEQFGVILPESTTFLDVLLPLTKLVKCGSLIGEAITSGANANAETIESAKRSLINEAESKVTGLSYGILGSPLDMVLYSIDDFRERQRQRAAAYAEADVKLKQYIAQTQDSTNQQFASFMKETAIPTFLSNIEEYYDALRDAEINVLKQNHVLVGNIPTFDDISKSSQIIKAALSEPNSDNEYAIALSLKKCPFNKSSFMMAAKAEVATDSLLSLASYVGFGDEASYTDIDKYSLLEKYVAGGKITVDGLAEYCANTTLFGEALSKNAFIFIRDEVLKSLSCTINSKLNLEYDGHNRDAIVASSRIIAEESLQSETKGKFSTSNIDISSCATQVANAFIKNQQSALYNKTLELVKSNELLSSTIDLIKRKESVLGSEYSVKLLQIAASRCEGELASIIKKYSASGTLPTYETVYNDVYHIITEQDITLLNSKAIQLFKQAFPSLKELSTYVLDQINTTIETNKIKEAQYLEACSLQEKAHSSDDYGRAAALFDTLTMYKDSTARQVECIKEQARLAKEEEYAEATSALEKAKTKSDYAKASAKFQALEDYKDSKEKIDAINKRNKRKHNISVLLSVLIGIIVLGSAVALYIFVLQPRQAAQRYALAEQQYSLATDALSSGDYVEAISGFRAAQGYKDADAILETIISEHPAAYCASLSVGESFVFGNYEGKELEWIILDKQENKALLISKDLLCEMPFGEERSWDYSSEPTTWADSSLREWLNGSFRTEAFSPDELPVILLTDVDTPDTVVNDSLVRNWVLEGGGTTADFLFPLSLDEARQYIDTIPKTDGYWWLRTRGTGSSKIAVVTGDGYIRADGVTNTHGKKGVTFLDVEKGAIFGPRPVMWISLES